MILIIIITTTIIIIILFFKTVMSNQRKVSDGYSQRGALTKTRILMKFLTSFLNITIEMKDRTDFLSQCFH